MKGKIASGPVCALAVGLTGCSSSTVDLNQYSGSLHDCSRLTQCQSPSGGTVKWGAPKLDLSNYSRVSEPIPIALMTAAVSTVSGMRDQEVDIAAEADFLDGNNPQVIAQVVRMGTGQPLVNNTQKLTPLDVKTVLGGGASDLHQSYLKLKAR